MNRRWVAAIAAVIALTASLLVAGVAQTPAPAQAASPIDGQREHGKIVSEDSANWTPRIINGSVRAITQVGNTVVAGGDFTRVANSDGSNERALNGLVLFEFGSGNISATNPTVVGRVEAVYPGVNPGTVWVGGALTSVNGQTGKAFLIDVNTGQVLRRIFTNGVVNDLTMAKGHLLVGGIFTKVGTNVRNGLASFNPTTGALDSFLSVATTEHHNYNGTGANAPVGPKSFDVSPDGNTLAVVGNFRRLDGLARDQIGVIDLSGATATVKADWATSQFGSVCARGAFDSWIRTVQYSPAGDYFAVTTTGGPFDLTLCDTTTAWSSTDTGANVAPLWKNATGGDTLMGLTVTDAAIYIGGHQRWVNNVDGRDNAAPGAMARPGIASLEPNSGVPNEWNPGKHPRGVNTYVMYGADAGMWIGFDTDYLGYFSTRRPRIAYFPVQGGTTPAKGNSGKLPGTLSRLNNSNQFLAVASEDGNSFQAQAGTINGLSTSTTRGATLVDGKLFYGSTDGYLHKRPYADGVLGDDVRVDPYHDPEWDTRTTGSGTSVYRGSSPEIYSQWNSINGIEYYKGLMYFTRSGDSRLFRTGFSPNSGAIEPFEASTTGRSLSGSLTSPGELVIAGDNVYYVNSTNGDLLRAPLTRTSVGASTRVSGPTVDGIDWRTRALFLQEKYVPPPNVDPTAAFSVTTDHKTVAFDAAASSDSDGTIQSYSWDFGDGTTDTGATVSHTYADTGSYDVTLTVTDDRNGTDTEQKSVEALAMPDAQFVAESGFNGTVSNAKVQVPAQTQAGDTLVLLYSTAATTDAAGTPTGGAGSWRDLGARLNNFESGALVGTADGSNEITIPHPSTNLKWDVRLLVYRGVDPQQATIDWATAASVASAKTPTVASPVKGLIEVDYWAAKSSGITGFGTPSTGVLRSSAPGTGSGRISGAAGDRTAAVSIGAPIGGSEIAFQGTATRATTATLVLPAAG